MSCSRCGADTPEVAHFCQTCGLDLRTPDLNRRKSFAVKPDEPVTSFALISTIMPRGATQRPQTYRIALGIGLTVALVAAIFGALPIAIMVAAFTIPVVYIVYLYDVNLWEDEPVRVTVAAFVLTGLLAIGWTLLWTQFRNPVPANAGGFGEAAGSGPQIGPFLLVALLVPIVSQLLIQIGPLYLASRPEFDDLMDGLTFGVISGVGYATFDTLVRHSGALFGGMAGREDATTWVALIFLEGFVKPLVMGTAAGIAAAEFSGLGEGYDGFTPRYFRGLAEAVLAAVAYQTGSYLFSFLPPAQGVALTLVWGVLILGVLILRVRTVLHAGLMEAALEHAARSHTEIGPVGDLDFCSSCEMPLVHGAAFCNACGTAVRTRPRPSKVAVTAGAPPGPPGPPGPPPADPGPAQTSGPSTRGSHGAEPRQPVDHGGTSTRPPESGPAAGEPHPSSQPTPRKHDGEEGRE